MKDKNSEWYKYFSNDFREHRKLQFFSIFYQAREPIINPNVSSMLEFGTGRNLTKAIVEHYGIVHKSVDFDNKKYSPDEVATIAGYRDKKKYDMVAAFQVLEHNPLEDLEYNLLKMKSHSKKYIYISLPYSGRWFSFSIFINLLPKISFKNNFFIVFQRFFKKIRPINDYKQRIDKYSPHWWEIGDKNFSKKKFQKLLNKIDLKLVKSYHNEFFPYHLFYLLEIKK
tara:strand:+ start:968 stop:1645 length:678 start_codon:yes stop_codon:yes gene_type:complete